MEKTQKTFNVKTIVSIGMFCALAYAVMLLSKLIPISISGFLSFDFKDAIIAISGFMFGPVPAIIISVIVSLIEMITVSSTGLIGLLMNILSTCAFVCPAALIYKSRKKFSGAIIGLVVGIVCQVIIMILWNWLVTPIYMGVDRAIVVSMLLPVFLPFNLIKGCINAALALLIYKPVITALRKARLVASSSVSDGNKPKTGITIGVTLVSIFLLATLVLVVLVWQNII